MEIGPTGQDISSPAHLSDHSWPYGGPEGRLTENIPHLIDLTCFTLFSVFSMEIGPTGQDISSPVHLSDDSWPMVGRSVDPPKIYPIQSILLVPIYVILGFHGDRSNRRRYILFGPPLGPLLALWWAGGQAHRKYNPSHRFCFVFK